MKKIIIVFAVVLLFGISAYAETDTKASIRKMSRDRASK